MAEQITVSEEERQALMRELVDLIVCLWERDNV